MDDVPRAFGVVALDRGLEEGLAVSIVAALTSFVSGPFGGVVTITAGSVEIVSGRRSTSGQSSATADEAADDARPPLHANRLRRRGEDRNGRWGRPSASRAGGYREPWRTAPSSPRASCALELPDADEEDLRLHVEPFSGATRTRMIAEFAYDSSTSSGPARSSSPGTGRSGCRRSATASSSAPRERRVREFPPALEVLPRHGGQDELAGHLARLARQRRLRAFVRDDRRLVGDHLGASCPCRRRGRRVPRDGRGHSELPTQSRRGCARGDERLSEGSCVECRRRHGEPVSGV